MILAPIVEIFCDIDDFYKSYDQNLYIKALPSPNGRRNRKTEMSASEMMTIMVLFHLSHYRTFKDFYLDCVLEQLSSYFPTTVGRVFKVLKLIKTMIKKLQTKFGANGCHDLSLTMLCGRN